MKSNYETMRDRMQVKFLEYDQAHMIEKYRLNYDETYLYIKFVGRMYRINRKNGKVEWSEDGFKNCTDAGYNEAMSIFDILCYSKDGCRLSGKFCNIHQLKGTVRSSGTGGTIFYHQIRYFDGKTEKLSQACEALGGEKETIGDVSYRLYPFEFLPMMLQFWNSDEEFPANLKIMWDENILDYVHFETAQFIASHVLHRIEEIMKIHMLKVILFDIDNTLLSFDEYVKESMKNGFAKYQLCAYEDEMFSVFNRINNSLWQAIEKGEMTFEELQKKRWNLIFEELGISFDGLIFEKYFGECLLESAIPENGALELLEYLRGKYILCAASNGPYLQQVNRLTISGMLPYFSHLFISEEIGCSKPSEDFFRTCLERLNLNMHHEIQPHEIIIVGDSISSDMMGGIEFGMQTCFYNPRKESIPNGLKVDYEVTSLEEIQQFA